MGDGQGKKGGQIWESVPANIRLIRLISCESPSPRLKPWAIIAIGSRWMGDGQGKKGGQNDILSL